MLKAYDDSTGELVSLAAVDMRKKKSKPKKDKTKKGRFGLLFKKDCNDVLTDSTLSHFEARVAMYLFTQTNWENQVIASHEVLAHNLEKPRSQISKAMKRLTERGVIRSIQNGVVEVNPRYFYMGEEEQRDEAIKEFGHLFEWPEADELVHV